MARVVKVVDHSSLEVKVSGFDLTTSVLATEVGEVTQVWCRQLKEYGALTPYALDNYYIRTGSPFFFYLYKCMQRSCRWTHNLTTSRGWGDNLVWRTWLEGGHLTVRTTSLKGIWIFTGLVKKLQIWVLLFSILHEQGLGQGFQLQPAAEACH